MINLCFSDSEKGALKDAQQYNNGSRAFGYIGACPSKEFLKNHFEGKALGGSSKDVIGVLFQLDIGEIAKKATDETRKTLLYRILKSPFENDEREQNELEKYWNSCIEDLNRLVECAKNGEHIRIWYSDAPYSVCGLHFVMSQIQEFDCKITGIKLPSFMENEDGSVTQYSSWSEVMPGKFYEFLPIEREIPKTLCKVMTQKWRELQSENSYLRAVVNGKLTSVSDDFYDYFIRKSIPDDEFMMARLIGEVLGKYQLAIGDWWLAERIQTMIANDEIKVVKKGDFVYSNTLKK
ncbi:MAG TPA: DUF1835 domain-containing protein [Desulfitobacterium dehalogenans]|uniref:DUF1835 domain-containing protein n=1 Tax=Desulfitobacterium dehalogenans TaxID=36854 RepID=A0A7C6Z7K0_9FIRM|nr:DUF1835 domain-containing protein [Desulfitobacterium dehalogenans]